MNQLRIVQLEKKFGEKKKNENPAFSLKPIQLTIEEGEFFSLLGPSGCGKTTLLKLIAGLLQPDSGRICLGISDVTEIPPEKRDFTMVFQQPLLFPHMTLEDNVAFGLKMQKAGKSERIGQARKMLEHVGLKGYGRRFPNELSGGQQQRASLARALLTHPKVLLMDEPFSALDPSLRGEMRELLSKIQKDFCVTVVFVTHDREEAFLLSDRIGVMGEGKLLQVGNVKELYENPASTQVASFLGMNNIIQGTVMNSRFSSKDSSLDFPVAGVAEEEQIYVIIRPETIILSQNSADGARNDQVRFKGIVRQLRFTHGFYLCTLQIGTVQLECSISSLQADGVFIGQACELRISLKDMQFVKV